MSEGLAKFEVSLVSLFVISMAAFFIGAGLTAHLTRDSIHREAMKAGVVYRDLEHGNLHFFNPCTDSIPSKLPKNSVSLNK